MLTACCCPTVPGPTLQVPHAHLLLQGALDHPLTVSVPSLAAYGSHVCSHTGIRVRSRGSRQALPLPRLAGWHHSGQLPCCALLPQSGLHAGVCGGRTTVLRALPDRVFQPGGIPARQGCAAALLAMHARVRAGGAALCGVGAAVLVCVGAAAVQPHTDVAHIQTVQHGAVWCSKLVRALHLLCLPV